VRVALLGIHLRVLDVVLREAGSDTRGAGSIERHRTRRGNASTPLETQREGRNTLECKQVNTYSAHTRFLFITRMTSRWSGCCTSPTTHVRSPLTLRAAPTCKEGRRSRGGMVRREARSKREAEEGCGRNKFSFSASKGLTLKLP